MNSLELLRDYALTFSGTPYIWGGDDFYGYDCSGFVQELMWAVGELDRKDRTANELYTYYLENGFIEEPTLGALAFFGSSDRVSHVAFCLDSKLMIEAADGGKAVSNPIEAQKANAFIKIRPISSRKDLVAIIFPKYKILGMEDQWLVKSIEQILPKKGESKMALKEIKVNVPKEAEELLDFLVIVVLALKKKDYGMIASNLPKLMDAISGLDQLDEEAKAHKDELIALIALKASKIAGAFLGE